MYKVPSYIVTIYLYVYIIFSSAGQTVDALATPFVGIMVDKFGKKKNWVLLGKYDYEYMIYASII